MQFRLTLLAATLLAAPALVAPALADSNGQTRFPATLAGHALLPAMSFAVPPADAPRALLVSGRFTGPGNARTEELGAIEGRTWIGPKDGQKRATGLSLPFVGQPIQGFSGVQHLGDGRFLAISDNGFGSRANSADAMLMAHFIRPDWETGRVEMERTVFLSDPNRVLPFPIVNEHSESRYLTGADFDLESVQLIDGTMWFGDEFGPWVFATNEAGEVTFITGTKLGDRALRSPDHPSLTLPSLPGAAAFEVRRSRGYEGMAASPDGATLYPMLEGPIWDEAAGAVETHDGREVLRILEFDVASRTWTGRSWKYLLEANGNNIGDFNMISSTRALVIERDNGEGDPAMACPEGSDGLDCFFTPARFKRVYLIDMEGVEPGGFVAKTGYVDLMDIADPNGIARQGGRDGRFTFPFVTVEDVDMVDDRHIIVGNDNNLPFSTGRAIGRADDNEWILLEVGDMLR